VLVLVPNAASPNAVRLAELRGAVVVRAGDGPAAVHGLAARLSREFGLANLASTFGAAGCEWACRGIGHEIADQIGDVDVRTLAASISVGPVLIGAGNGLREAGRAIPTLVAAQAAGCAPIAEAYATGSDDVLPWTGPAVTSALAIADRLTGYAHEATYALRQVRASGGVVEAATDEEMHAMRHALARYDGLDVELASCAAAVVLRRGGRTGPGTVCVLTGAGTKETLAVDAPAGQVPTIEEYAERSGTGDAFVKEIEAWLHTSPS
jgi:threonine synthase